MGFLLRWLQRILFIGMLVCLWSGGWGLWNGLRHSKPTELVLAGTKPDVPDYVALKNIELGIVDAVVSERFKVPEAVYFPIRPRGAPKSVAVFFLLKSTDPELLQQFGQPKSTGKKDEANFKQLAAMTRALLQYTEKTEMTGMLASELDTSSSLQSDLKKMIPTLDHDFKVFVEGEKPSWLRGLGLLAGAFGCLVLLGLTAKSDPAPTAAPPPLAAT